jgi:hypothetical protein
VHLHLYVVVRLNLKPFCFIVLVSDYFFAIKFFHFSSMLRFSKLPVTFVLHFFLELLIVFALCFCVAFFFKAFH